jgi:steroid 5-alpha reductase family enzyme
MAGVWMTYGPAFINGVLFVLGFFVLTLWLASVVMKDSSIVDIFWGLGCAAMAWIFYLSAGGSEPRATLTVLLATAWGVRLGVYIGARNWGAEDRRYARLRQHITDKGKNYVIYSLRAVFLFQGCSMVVCTLPLLVAIVTPGNPGLGAAGWIGVVLIAVGTLTEAVADWQMSRFRASRTPGQVMDRGLWRYSRHPNYFGEMLVQWGFFLMAVDATVWGVLTIAGPAVLSYLIIGPMGANLLERRLGKKNPGYDAYVKRTSAFIPLPPKKA